MAEPLRQQASLRIVLDRADEPAPGASALPTGADAFDAMYLRYAPYVAAVGIRLLGRDDEVEDLVQDVFVQVMRSLGQLREAGAFKGWLAQITVRAATRRLRQRNLRRALLGAPAEAHYEALCASSSTPEERALVAQVYAVLDTLPATWRVIWVLRHVEGESLQAIAALVGCSMSTVQRRLADAQAAIHERLQDAPE